MRSMTTTATAMARDLKILEACAHINIYVYMVYMVYMNIHTRLPRSRMYSQYRGISC